MKLDKFKAALIAAAGAALYAFMDVLVRSLSTVQEPSLIGKLAGY